MTRLVFVYRFLTVGGVENVLAERIAALGRRGIDSAAVFLEDAGGRPMFPEGTGRVEVCRDPADWGRIAARLDPDAIFSIDTPEALPAARSAAPRARLVYEVHTPYPPGLALLRDPGALPGVESLAVPSPSQAALVRQLVRAPIPVHVIPNSLPAKFRTPPAPGEAPPRPVVAWVGRLDYLKNWRGFVEIARDLAGTLDADFRMVGGARSPEREKEELAVRTRDLAEQGRFRWIPETDPAGMPAFYAAVAASGGCVVSTSWAESFGLVVLEAMAAGCPVVAPDVVGVRDLVEHGRTGWVFAAEDPREGALRVREAVAGDPPARRRIVAAAREAALAYTPERSIDALLAVAGGRAPDTPAASPVGERAATLRAALSEITRDISETVADRDATIRALQKEMHGKVAERDRAIRDHQRSYADLRRSADELARAHRGALGDLARTRDELALERATLEIARADLERVYASRPWKLATRWWKLTGAVRRILGKGAAEPLPASIPEPGAAPPAPASPAALAPPPSPLEKAPVDAADRHDVVCFPIIDWDFRFQRPQQLMTRFAEAGHRVFYVSQRFRSSGPPWELLRKARNVYEVTLRGPSRNVYRDTLDARAAEALFESLDALRRDLSLGATAAVVQLPFWWPLAKKARDRFAWPVVYDCMDHHAGFTTNTETMLALEEDLRKSAALVVASSTFLADEARALNPNVLLLRNACDYPHFAAAGAPRPRAPRPVVGYYGAIADWFDSDLVAEVARARPDWDFVLVGSTFSADISRLRKLPNVSFPGEKPYAEIPEWLARFDVAIIPFKRIPLTEATNPVKAYEIFAAGKPLVAVPLPEIAAMAPHVRLASTAPEFAREIEAALADPARGAAERAAFARENTWEKRFEALAPAVAAAFPPASVIVVTYGNRDLNRLCLASLAERTEWPNYEVIVVDNASADGTRELLREAAGADPRLRVVFNDANLGFAAANNRGLDLARGEFLVLLNNDTVVPRGWLAALVRHLSAERTIGLIGPVTNQIGNEARIDVGYADVEDMPDWASRFVRENDGRTFPIPMLAMFCVAMRREVFAEIGPLDERFGVGMFEDDDYTHRVRAAGYEIVCCRDAFVHHWMKASFNRMPEEEYRALFERNRRIFEEKWGVTWTPHLSRAEASAPAPEPGEIDQPGTAASSRNAS